MQKAVIVYIHGKGGSPEEAEHYRPLFPGCPVIGMRYRANTPWEAREEFTRLFAELSRTYDSITLIANSIGAYFAMQAELPAAVRRAFFISPMVDMEKCITNSMTWAGVTEEDLQQRGEIPTGFGDPLSWEYLSFVRSHPIRWSLPTHILYGENDALTSLAAITAFAEKTAATLDIHPGGEHWFHTPEQMAFLDSWLLQY